VTAFRSFNNNTDKRVLDLLEAGDVIRRFISASVFCPRWTVWRTLDRAVARGWSRNVWRLGSQTCELHLSKHSARHRWHSTATTTVVQYPDLVQGASKTGTMRCDKTV